MKIERIRRLNGIDYSAGGVLYWMDREMRLNDNWALIRAVELAKRHKTSICVVYNLVSDYLGGGRRQLDFKLSALKQLETDFTAKNIPFFVVTEKDCVSELHELIKKFEIGYVVTDMNPSRINRSWKTKLAKFLSIPFEEVDAHNIVPVWEASSKQEFAARTIRPKLYAKFHEYLEEFPTIRKQPALRRFLKVHWKDLQSLPCNEEVTAVDWIKPGEKEAHKMLKRFIDERLMGYAEKRNDPNEQALSNLSPYFHYGMIAPARAIMEVRKANAPLADKEAFIEEAFVRRELADNYCYYQKFYDSFEGFPEWAKQSLNAHRKDKRPYVYTMDEFEQGKTHDDLWNAAQMEMVKTGKMHGYMRMYWAKKILEWTHSAAEAQKIAIYLNDKYELDGRDPNGYAGIAWSIGGLHDRPWFDRPIFGQIRYMNANGAKKKFDVERYIERCKNL